MCLHSFGACSLILAFHPHSILTSSQHSSSQCILIPRPSSGLRMRLVLEQKAVSTRLILVPSHIVPCLRHVYSKLNLATQSCENKLRYGSVYLIQCFAGAYAFYASQLWHTGTLWHWLQILPLVKFLPSSLPPSSLSSSLPLYLHSVLYQMFIQVTESQYFVPQADMST